jgi:hypothetical protein
MTLVAIGQPAASGAVVRVRVLGGEVVRAGADGFAVVIGADRSSQIVRTESFVVAEAVADSILSADGDRLRTERSRPVSALFREDG